MPITVLSWAKGSPNSQSWACVLAMVFPLPPAVWITRSAVEPKVKPPDISGVGLPGLMVGMSMPLGVPTSFVASHSFVAQPSYSSWAKVTGSSVSLLVDVPRPSLPECKFSLGRRLTSSLSQCIFLLGCSTFLAWYSLVVWELVNFHGLFWKKASQWPQCLLHHKAPKNCCWQFCKALQGYLRASE